MGAFTKRWTIDRRRTRRHKIKALRKRYQAAGSEAQRAAILQKALQTSPKMSLEDFLGPMQKEGAEAKEGRTKAAR
jgi:hypothetical protein